MDLLEAWILRLISIDVPVHVLLNQHHDPTSNQLMHSNLYGSVFTDSGLIVCPVTIFFVFASLLYSLLLFICNCFQERMWLLMASRKKYVYFVGWWLHPPITKRKLGMLSPPGDRGVTISSSCHLLTVRDTIRCLTLLPKYLWFPSSLIVFISHFRQWSRYCRFARERRSEWALG